jgi:hypothetical protein
MSNHLAVATVTEALRVLLERAAKEAVQEVTTNTGRPKSAGDGQAQPVINIYLYQVTPNVALRNADLPTRRADGTFVGRPQAALTLHYLFSFYGDDTKLEPQRLLGSAVSALHAQPVLTRAIVENAKNSALDGILAESDLADQVERVKLAPVALNLEELSKLWSVSVPDSRYAAICRVRRSGRVA